jgi:hypothetical protein
MKTKQSERRFAFLRMNECQAKSRIRGMTEIRPAYCAPFGNRYCATFLKRLENLRAGGFSNLAI